ncbi:hypothetical protein ACLOJK_000127 [Asimina triloba]
MGQDDLSRPPRHHKLGMASALETLCGQSYGAKQYHMLGIYLQRSWIVEIICTLFIIPLFIFTTPLLRLLGQDAEIAAVAGTISLWFIPVIFSFIFSFTLQMYLQAQSKNMIIAYLAAVSLSLHVLLSWLLTMKLQWGIPGVMWSMVLALWIPIFGQYGFVVWGGCPETWKGFSMLAFKDLWPVAKLSLSSGVMLCLELWYNTILVLLTGHLANAEIAIDALSICLNINGWEMMISVGFLAAASVRVSNELGRGSAKAAKFSVIVTVTTSFAIGFVLFIMFLLFRGKISYIFTESKDVSLAVADLSPLLAFSILLNSIQPVLSGQLLSYSSSGIPSIHLVILAFPARVAVGAGWQSMVAYVNLACYYLLTTAASMGIWVGMLLGTLVQTLVLMFLTWRTDWDKQVALTSARVKQWTLPAATEDTNGGSPAP